jgi:pimeloyl-ACP methyl ester carboxylesterase
VEVLNGILDRMHLVDAAARVSVPTLLVYGGADRIVPPEQGILLQRTLPRSELVLVRGGTHLATVFDEAAITRGLAWLEGGARRPRAARG